MADLQVPMDKVIEVLSKYHPDAVRAAVLEVQVEMLKAQLPTGDVVESPRPAQTE